jgi:hypothetical protein
MNGEAKDLRELALAIEQVTSESRACSMVWEQVRQLVDYITLRARLMELEGEEP